MKIIQVNVVFDKGSTGKIVNDVHKYAITNKYDSIICYGRGKRVRQNKVVKFCSETEAAIQKINNQLGGLMYGGNYFSTQRLINYITHEKPDVVHLHCINGYCVNIYKLLAFLAKVQIKTVVTHHAEFFYTGNCGHALDCMKFSEQNGCIDCPRPFSATGARFLDRAHTAWNKMRSAFSKFDRQNLVFTTVSPWLLNRSKLSPIVAGFDCTVIENGLNTQIFHSLADSREARSLISGCREKMILHVTASFSDIQDTFKGGDKIIELARLMPDVSFVIVATYHSISQPLPENVYFYGRTKDQQTLAALYNAADLTVIASKRETFSMVVAESLCCGTPVVGFEAGGPESIAIYPYCKFVSQNDGINGLRIAAQEMLSKNYSRNEISKAAIQKFDSSIMAKKYCELYSAMLQNS